MCTYICMYNITVRACMQGIYDPTLLHDYGGLALVNNVVYIPLGGLCDNGNYVGQVASVNVSAPLAPNRGPVFNTVPGASSNVWGGGIWGSGGVVFALNYLWTAAGNAIGAPSEWSYYGEHAIQLNPGALTVANSFSAGETLNGISDGDFGATPAVFTPSASSGCTQSLVTLQHSRV